MRNSWQQNDHGKENNRESNKCYQRRNKMTQIKKHNVGVNSKEHMFIYFNNGQ